MEEKNKAEQADAEKTQEKKKADQRPATPQRANPQPVQEKTEKKELSLRDFVERQDDAGVRKYLNERPYMVSSLFQCIPMKFKIACHL